MRGRFAVGIFLLSAASLPLGASASSDSAWSEFRAAVANACTVKAKALLVSPVAKVDPYGTTSYGIAIVRGIQKGTAPPKKGSVVCVYDKKTKKAEVSGIVEPTL